MYMHAKRYGIRTLKILQSLSEFGGFRKHLIIQLALKNETKNLIQETLNNLASTEKQNKKLTTTCKAQLIFSSEENNYIKAINNKVRNAIECTGV